ncbi:5'-nucleotidase, lipoprotein e(P4) family [Paracoccus sp. CPCC 101403]|uniref:5'-nucleotidase, lipoprotein e(P4) family n=1 Tax=Paracoccus broussonetiae TaxID=3075834 RepID=A0ABU3EIL2_9RHOB|nr:5'-nucleotidase, lipoprotein e(P4) family [Paracoccus sp. CPCC 101403]MDT1064082.1 5'-nucleotidase, lipoprotein e(P4) family [Paracoccus sp. CPCC 101403]
MIETTSTPAIAALTLGLGLALGFGPAAADEAKPPCAEDSFAMGLRYQQQSAEVAALQRQAYALARIRLDEALAKAAPGEKLAIVTDLDETVIDNSALLVRDMQACHDYTTWDTWKHWEREGNPTLIPGALDFFTYADQKGVAVYYLSDRYDENKAQTKATLETLGLPKVTDETVLLLGPPKQERRELVEKDHKVVMLLGDTLHDFSEDFTSKVPVDKQRDLVAEQAEHVGRDWIVLPNAGYGTWSKTELKAWDAPIKAE